MSTSSATKLDANVKSANAAANSPSVVEVVSVPSHGAEITTQGVTTSARPVFTVVSLPASTYAPRPEPVQSQSVIPVIYASDDDTSISSIQRIAFRAGVSSITVERLARQYGCNGGRGAALITDEGPVEMYRMICDTGAVFLSKCDLRQCVPFK